MSAQGDKRRADILRFVQGYTLEHGYGPAKHEIERHLDYRGHALRSKHLDKMPEIYQADNGRWMPVEESRSKHVGLIHPVRSDRKFVPWPALASILRRGIGSLSAQLSLAVDEGKDTEDIEAMLETARAVEEWLEQGIDPDD